MPSIPEPPDPDLSALDPLDLSEAELSTLTRWLVANDPNGCYTPDDRGAEGLPPMDIGEALGHYRLQSGATDIHPVDLRTLLSTPSLTDSHMLTLDPETGRYGVEKFIESLPPVEHVDLLTVYTLAGLTVDWEAGFVVEFSDADLARIARRLNASEIPDC